MVNRWFGIVSITLALLANGALFWRHVLPHMLVGEPPLVPADAIEVGDIHRIQVGIYNAGDVLIGRSWAVLDRAGQTVTLESLSVLEPTRLPNGMPTIPLAVHSEIDYQADGPPDALNIEILGLDFPARLTGENFSGDFPCKWEFAGQSGSFLVDSDLLHTLRDSLRPFDRLPGLYEGQTWKVGVFDPFSKVFNMSQSSLTFDEMLVEVVGKETILHPHTHEEVEVFRVEANQVVAWVAPDGKVLKQSVYLPILGQLTVVDEPFDDEAYSKAIRRWLQKQTPNVYPESEGYEEAYEAIMGNYFREED